MLTLRHLSKTYADGTRALAGVDLAIRPSEIVALIGGSGCGKTTLLRLVAGLDRASEGEIELDGDRIAEPHPAVGVVFQEPRLLPWRTLEENLALVLPEDPGTGARIARALAEVGLEGHAAVYASRLSLGMARRAALARAFAVEPSLLLLDEPFVSLDEPTAQRLRLLLLALLERHGTAALFVTHHLTEAIMLAQRLVFLEASPARIVAEREVTLADATRRDPLAVETFRQRLLAEDKALTTLLAPGDATAGLAA